MADVLVVGCGLIGTSIGLALQGGAWGDVLLSDRDEAALATAVARGAGRRWDGHERAGLAVVAVPPRAVVPELLRLQELDIAHTYTHVASIQAQVQEEVEALSSDPSLIVGGHPLAGRELSGPEAALADLFVGRPWAVCPASGSDERAVEAVAELARECGASPLRVPASAHDRAVALSSHLPQVASSALAAVLADPALSTIDLSLAGPGLVDTTRLAAGDAALWLEILVANAAQLAGPVRTLGASLLDVAAALDTLAAGPATDEAARGRVRHLLELGNAGRERVPVKRGEAAGSFVGVRVEVADEPGRLAALLDSAAQAEINVEDVRVEHVPGRPRGVIELLVAPDAERRLRTALDEHGWQLV